MKLVTKRKLSEKVVLHVARRIVAGRIQPGDTMPAEIDLVSECDVSKAAVREGVQILAAVGLITIRHGKRALVRVEADWNVLHPLVQEAYRLEKRGEELAEQLYDVRFALECLVAEEAAKRISNVDLERLAALSEKMKGAEACGISVPEFLDLDREFHMIIARASGNLAAVTVLKSMASSKLGDWWRTKISPEDLPALAEQHDRISLAVATGDAQVANQMMAEHLRSARSGLHLPHID